MKSMNEVETAITEYEVGVVDPEDPDDGVRWVIDRPIHGPGRAYLTLEDALDEAHDRHRDDYIVVGIRRREKTVRVTTTEWEEEDL